MRTFFKTLKIFPLVALYFLSSAIISVLPVSENTRRGYFIKNTSLFCRAALSACGVRVRAYHRERLRKGDRLIVSNHLSYLDVLIISSIAPSVFITSVELKHTPFLGTFAKFGGSVFVERRSPSGLKREIAEISRLLGEGFRVVLFAEGTTSDGACVRPFKNPLMQSAVESGAEVLPLCVRYTKANGGQVTAQNKDFIFWYGGMRFFSHASRLLTLRSVDVELIPLDPIPVRSHPSRKQLAALSHSAVSAAYRSH